MRVMTGIRPAAYMRRMTVSQRRSLPQCFLTRAPGTHLQCAHTPSLVQLMIDPWTMSPAERRKVACCSDAAPRSCCAALVSGGVGGVDATVIAVLDQISLAGGVACAIGRAFPLYDGKGQRQLKAGEPVPGEKAAPMVRVGFATANGPLDATAAPYKACAAACNGVRRAARLVDLPPDRLTTTAFVDEARAAVDRLAAHGKAVSCSVIAGEALREAGYGMLYGVGKAATEPPALVILSHQPAASKPSQTVALVGKGARDSFVHLPAHMGARALPLVTLDNHSPLLRYRVRHRRPVAQVQGRHARHEGRHGRRAFGYGLIPCMGHSSGTPPPLPHASPCGRAALSSRIGPPWPTGPSRECALLPLSLPRPLRFCVSHPDTARSSLALTAQAAALLGAFEAAVEIGVGDRAVHLVLCLAENAIGPLAVRNDDIIRGFSGLTCEINNSDAEGTPQTHSWPRGP